MLPITAPTGLLSHVGHVDSTAGAGGPDPAAALLAALPFLLAAVLLRSRHAAVSTVVVFSAAAGFVHAMATPPHFREGLAVGLFTLAVTVGQMAVVVAALDAPSRALWGATAAANLAVLLIWALSRTVGLPLGPQPWTPEPVGLLDLACAAYEVALVAGSLKLLVGRGLMAPDSGPKVPMSRAGALANL